MTLQPITSNLTNDLNETDLESSEPPKILGEEDCHIKVTKGDQP